MKILEYKKVHCIGIGGIGVSAAAKYFKLSGADVSGSDIEETFITRGLLKMGIRVHFGHNEKNLPGDAELVIFSPAAIAENPEMKKAALLSIPAISYPEFLGELAKLHKTIAVSGTHGKSTTTALIGLALSAAGFDPLVIVGTIAKEFKHGNLSFGNGEWFVVEACEYKGNMRRIKPDIAVITSIEPDHLDYYKDLDHIVQSFQAFADGIKKGGALILNTDYETCRQIKNRADVKRIEYNSTQGREFNLNIPGKHNVLNARAAYSACHAALEQSASLDMTALQQRAVLEKSDLQIEENEIERKLVQGIESFSGIWRRFELLGEMALEGGGNAPVVSDYGHHPTAIRETLAAAREFFKDKKIILVYQPHQRSRTKSLFNGFVEELSKADVLIGVEVYDVAGREDDIQISTKDIIKEINKKNRHSGGANLNGGTENAIYAKGPDQALDIVKSIAKAGHAILIMGAGNIWEIGQKLARPK